MVVERKSNRGRCHGSTWLCLGDRRGRAGSDPGDDLMAILGLSSMASLCASRLAVVSYVLLSRS